MNQRGNSRRLGAYFGDTKFAGEVIHEENQIVLRGLLWIASSFKDQQMARAIAATALSAYRKLPGIGPRALKIGNAAIYALSEMACEDAVAQLAMLKVRVKVATAQKEIEKAFTASAEALGMPRDQIEELGVPTYGLEEVGLRRTEFGEDIAAELRVDGKDFAVTKIDDLTVQVVTPDIYAPFLTTFGAGVPIMPSRPRLARSLTS